MLQSDDSLSDTFAALADPTRRAILGRLTQGEATVKELAEPFSISLPAVSRHLKVLERAGLISRGRSAQWRPCRLEAEPLERAALWLQGYRAQWEQGADRLARFLSVGSDAAAVGESFEDEGEAEKSMAAAKRADGERTAVKTGP